MAAHIPGTIVVIDDDPLVRRAIVRLLRLAPCTVETFESAEAFLGRPRREAPACLILDVDLPGLSGPALQRTLAVAQLSHGSGDPADGGRRPAIRGCRVSHQAL
jgi:FixJ family two-component response regulator